MRYSTSMTNSVPIFTSSLGCNTNTCGPVYSYKSILYLHACKNIFFLCVPPLQVIQNPACHVINALVKLPLGKYKQQKFPVIFTSPHVCMFLAYMSDLEMRVGI